jgi:hypothetical protein
MDGHSCSLESGFKLMSLSHAFLPRSLIGLVQLRSSPQRIPI